MTHTFSRSFRALKAIAAVLFVIGLANSAGAVTLNPVADTDNQSDVAAGTNATLNISQYCTPFLKFDLSSVSGTITAATLRVYFGGGLPATTITVSTTSNDTWVEGGTKPTIGSVITTKTIGATGAGYIDIDLTSHTQAKMTGDKIVSVTLNDTTSGWMGLNSRQSSSNQPQLVVATSGGGSVLVSSIAVSPSSASIGAGNSTTLGATVSPSNATNPAVSWTSSNTGVATVNSSGVVTGVAAGSANIIAHSTDSSSINSNACAVTVTAAPVMVTGITVSPSSSSVVAGNTTTLSATVTPSNATNQTLTWTSGNTGVATVNSSGVVTGVAAGSTTITAHATDGSNVSSNNASVTVTAAGGGTTTLNPVADTDNQSDVTAGTNATLNISQYCTPFFKFDLSGVSGSVTASTLRVYFGGGLPATTLTVSTTSNDTWVEGGTKPTIASAITTKTIGTTGAGYIDIDLTALTQTKMTGNKIVSVALADTTSGWMGLNSRQASSNRPQLVVTTGGGGGGSVIVSSITLSPTSASITAGNNTALTATVLPSNASNPTLTWSSSSTGVATVSSSGVVHGVAAGSATISAHSTDGGNVTSNGATIVVTGGGGGTVSRPSYNTGTGLFVLGNKLYDANGHEFVIRGVNKLHWDSTSPGIVKTNANAVRWVIDFNQPTSTNLNLMQGTINDHMVPIPGNWGSGSCPPESQLPGIVDTWIAQKSAWLTIDSKMILNIANELGGGNSTAWRDAYITAIGRLRAAGYLCTIMVDAGGCGQDNDDLANYAAAILNSDPQKNVIFSQHIYGNWGINGSPSWAIDLDTGLDRLAATGLCFVVGEFGPGRNIGPSPTLITPGQIITAADAHNFGWLAWAWDDPAFNADDNWFAMSFNGDYNSSADLTTFGKDVVENSSYGLKARAVKQTAF